YLSRFFISQRNVAWAGLLRRDVRLAVVKIIIRARDPCVGIVRRLLAPFGEQRLDLLHRMLVQQLSGTTSVFLAPRQFGLRVDVYQGFQDLLERAGIFLVTGFISGREDDVSDSLRKLDIADAFPLGVILCRRVFVNKVIVPVLGLARSNFLLRNAMLFLH